MRDKVIVALLALGGLREGTLVKLRYRPVADDLERGVVPLHVHVESEITKRKLKDKLLELEPLFRGIADTATNIATIAQVFMRTRDTKERFFGSCMVLYGLSFKS